MGFAWATQGILTMALGSRFSHHPPFQMLQGSLRDDEACSWHSSLGWEQLRLVYSSAAELLSGSWGRWLQIRVKPPPKSSQLQNINSKMAKLKVFKSKIIKRSFSPIFFFQKVKVLPEPKRGSLCAMCAVMRSQVFCVRSRPSQGDVAGHGAMPPQLKHTGLLASLPLLLPESRALGPAPLAHLQANLHLTNDHMEMLI